MEELGGLSHLYLTLYLHSFAVIMVAPAITDITLSALCPGEDECSLAIYLSGFQQAVCFLPHFPIILIPIMQLHYLVSPSSLLSPPFRNSVYVPLNLDTYRSIWRRRAESITNINIFYFLLCFLIVLDLL